MQMCADKNKENYSIFVAVHALSTKTLIRSKRILFLNINRFRLFHNNETSVAVEPVEVKSSRFNERNAKLQGPTWTTYG